MESNDLIRRSDAKAAMINLVLHVLKPNVIGPWERSIEEALGSVPAAVTEDRGDDEADGA